MDANGKLLANAFDPVAAASRHIFNGRGAKGLDRFGAGKHRKKFGQLRGAL